MTNIEMKTKWEIWPLAIIGSFVLFAAFIFTCVFLMMQEDVGLVSPNYYKEEIAFQGQIDKSNRSEADHVKVIIRNEKENGFLSLSLPAATKEKISGEIKFIRLSDSKLDFKLAFSPDESGKQIVPVSQLKAGLWKIVLDWKLGDITYYQDEMIHL